MNDHHRAILNRNVLDDNGEPTHEVIILLLTVITDNLLDMLEHWIQDGEVKYFFGNPKYSLLNVLFDVNVFVEI